MQTNLALADEHRFPKDDVLLSRESGPAGKSVSVSSIVAPFRLRLSSAIVAYTACSGARWPVEPNTPTLAL